MAGNRFSFSFSTVTGGTYTVQQNTNLATTDWPFCTNITGNGSLYQFEIPLNGSPQHFFRVRQP